MAVEVKNLNNEKALRIAVLKALESCSCTATVRVTLLYGNHDACQIADRSAHRQSAEGSQAMGWDDLPAHLKPHKGIDGGFLGIYTKSQATFKNTGVERLHNFILQDQACKLLPKHRVCNCLKTNR